MKVSRLGDYVAALSAQLFERLDEPRRLIEWVQVRDRPWMQSWHRDVRNERMQGPDVLLIGSEQVLM